MIRYTVTPADPRAHLFAVSCRVPNPDPKGAVFRLPSWIRGSYLVRDFARHVVDLGARDEAGPVAITRLDKRSFACAPARGALTLEYTVYSYEESVRKAFLDARRGFFNGSSLFYAAAGRENEPLELELKRPADLPAWRVATAMTPVAADAEGFGLYRAGDYEELIDHPVEMGEFQRIDFAVDGILHSHVLAGRTDGADLPRLARDTEKICHVQRELFGQEPKLDRYVFMTRVLGTGYGGLEHRASTALVCSRGDLPRPGGGMPREYRAFLGLISHEYFHLWNVKRITPASFAESDLAAEAYTRDLWHYEGVTSYYDDLMLLRAGLIDAPAYLDLVAETATRLARTPGRRRQSLAEASFEAWLKYYQPDENSPNATVSYYIKGALAGLCLDLHLRRHSAITLDEVMRALWQRHGREGTPVPERGLERLASELSGLDLAPLLDTWLRSTAELPLAELLAEFGVEARARPAVGEADPGGRLSGRPMPATLGLRLRPGELTVAHVLDGGAAQQAGVSGGDVLVALDGLRLSPAQWPVRLAALQPGRDCTLHFFRGDELLSATLTPQPAPSDTWTLTLTETPAAEALARRKTWLGS